MVGKICRSRYAYTVTALLSLSALENLCFGFTSLSPTTARARAPPSATSSIQRPYSSQDDSPQAEESGGFDDILVNGTDAPTSDDVDRVEQNKVDEIFQKERTLYEILEAPPTATRSELKQCYVKLAKATHPDAMIGNGVDSTDRRPDFSDVASAWRVLGDTKLRKRYDRELRAKEFSENAQKFANEKLEQGFSDAAEMLNNVAIPFIRKTTATTWAVGQAVAKGVSGLSSQQEQKQEASDAADFQKFQTKQQRANATNNTQDAIQDIFVDALEAGQNAERAMDSLEIAEKSSDLEEQMETEQKRELDLQQELQNVTERRVFATLNYPTLDLSSEEAELVLEKLEVKQTDESKSKVVNVGGFLRSNNKKLNKEISQLREAEQQFNDGLARYDETDREWHTLLDQSETAKAELTKRKDQEIEARKALERAQRMVLEAKEHLVTTTNALKSIEQRVRSNAQEMDRVTASLSKKQNKVRLALRQKVQLSDIAPTLGVENLSEEDVATLRRKELMLTGETKQVSLMVARLQSRAEKLRLRAEALEQQSPGPRVAP